MKKFITKRIISSILTVYLVATIVFITVRAIPGDPVRVIAPNAGRQQAQAIRDQLDLGVPLHEQYANWLIGITTGDFGTSIYTDVPVLDSLAGVAEPTVSIAILGMILALVIGIPLGVISSIRQYELEDNIATTIAFLTISLPAFWLAIVFIIVFDQFGFATFGYESFTEGPVVWLQHVILPAMAVGVPYGGILQRFVRSSMLEVMNEDYITVARAKGLDERLVIFKHAFQNALIPVITMAGILFAILLSGIIAVEIVFGIQGLGRLLISSIERRDFPLIQGTVVVISIVFVFTNLLVDILYAQINPKIKY